MWEVTESPIDFIKLDLSTTVPFRESVTKNVQQGYLDKLEDKLEDLGMPEVRIGGTHFRVSQCHFIFLKW